jgi:NAD-dependent oxidoreductase involved in siderophore biosynthesis
MKKGKKLAKKMTQGFLGSATGLMASSAAMGMGSQALGRIGGTSAVHGQQALSNLSGYMPLAGKAAGAGMALSTLKEVGSMEKKRKRKRKRR